MRLDECLRDGQADAGTSLAPVPAGAEVACCFRLAEVEDKGAGRQLLRLEAAARVEGADKPAIVGEVLALVVG